MNEQTKDSTMSDPNLMVQPRRLKIETPIGSVESDSGNHGIDILSIAFIIGLVIVCKKVVEKWVK